jgi:hypothetical protein
LDLRRRDIGGVYIRALGRREKGVWMTYCLGIFNRVLLIWFWQLSAPFRAKE